jgi:hypothetical protein
MGAPVKQWPTDYLISIYRLAVRAPSFITAWPEHPDYFYNTRNYNWFDLFHFSQSDVYPVMAVKPPR